MSCVKLECKPLYCLRYATKSELELIERDRGEINYFNNYNQKFCSWVKVVLFGSIILASLYFWHMES
jgi:hypothetical protein